MASQKYYVFSVMHVRRSTYTEYIRGSLLRVVQCALAFRCKATDICAREPLLDAVETSALMVPAAAYHAAPCAPCAAHCRTLLLGGARRCALCEGDGGSMRAATTTARRL